MKELTVSDVTDFLHSRLLGQIREVAPLGNGAWSQAFSFRQDGASLVVRFGVHPEDYHKDRRASGFSAPSLPVPRVLELGEAFDGHFCLSERAFGTYLEGQGALEMRRSVPAICELLDTLRQTKLGDSSGFGGWDGSGNAPHTSWHDSLLAVDQESERVHGWHARLEESPTGMAPFREALDYLESHLGHCPNERHLIHNDLLHFNVLVAEGKIQAVVDWGNSLYGDFLYELAAFTFYAPWYPAMDGIDWEQMLRTHWEAQGVALPHVSERLKCYQAHLGLDNMAYCAFTHRWDDLADTARRTLALLRS